MATKNPIPANRSLVTKPSTTVEKNGEKVKVLYNPGMMSIERAVDLTLGGATLYAAPLYLIMGYTWTAAFVALLGAHLIYEGLKRPKEEQKEAVRELENRALDAEIANAQRQELGEPAEQEESKEEETQQPSLLESNAETPQDWRNPPADAWVVNDTCAYCKTPLWEASPYVNGVYAGGPRRRYCSTCKK